MLRLAFLLNLVLLIPVCASLYWQNPQQPLAVWEGKAQDSAPLRMLIASLWGAILLGSIAGLVWPRECASLLLFQIVYKGLYLILFLMPQASSGGLATVPLGITASFGFIVLLYPWILIREFLIS